MDTQVDETLPSNLITVMKFSQKVLIRQFWGFWLIWQFLCYADIIYLYVTIILLHYLNVINAMLLGINTI